MRPRSRRSFGLPLVVSLILHVGLLAGILAFTSRGASTLGDITNTRLVVQLVSEEKASKGPTSGAKAEEEQEQDAAVVTPLPLNSASTAERPSSPVVVGQPPSSPGGNSPAAVPGTKSTGQAGNNGGIFAAAPTATKVVYVLDRSGSMGQQGAYRLACGEVLAHVRQLPPATRFQVVPYNSRAEPLCVNTSVDLLPTDAETLRTVAAQLAALAPTGWTDHLCGLKCALALSPDVIFLVTDADDLKPEEVLAITKLNKGRTVIHTIEMHSRNGSPPSGELAQLAVKNQGTYRRVLLDD